MHRGGVIPCRWPWKLLERSGSSSLGGPEKVATVKVTSILLPPIPLLPASLSSLSSSSSSSPRRPQTLAIARTRIHAWCARWRQHAHVRTRARARAHTRGNPIATRARARARQPKLAVGARALAETGGFARSRARATKTKPGCTTGDITLRPDLLRAIQANVQFGYDARCDRARPRYSSRVEYRVRGNGDY